MNAFLRDTVLAALLFSLIASAACARGADEGRLERDLQEKLDQDVKPGLFEVVGVRRAGSAPLSASRTGAARVVVYFNATVRINDDYRFGAWDQLSPSSVAFALGATEKGIFGLKPENRAGDIVRAYGRAIYERHGDAWVRGDTETSTVAAAPDIEGSSPPSRSKQLIDRLAAMVELPPPGVPALQDEIIAEELARASENIERRVKRREHTYTLATGPEDGEYARFGSALVGAVNAAAPQVQLRHRYSEGSVENAWLLARGDADYAIVQGDVAAAAYAGDDLFARGGPLASLRAVGGLFPEAIHVVVLHDSSIRDIGALRGRRVAVGEPASGTRFDAIAVLAGHGVTAGDLGELCEDPLPEALVRLRRKQVDAVFLTGPAPTRMLQELSVSPGIRLLPIGGAALGRVLDARPGLTRITLPPNTYPRQREPVVTAASTALLLTTAASPAGEVERLSDLVFTRMPKQPGGADVARVSSGGERHGVTLPLHPGAATDRRDPP